MKKNKNVVCMLAMASIIAPSVASIDFNETNVAYASDSVEKIVKYVTQGNGGGDGSQGNPYQGIEEAINSAPEGAILKLTSNVSVQNERAINFKKNLTIDGQNLYELGLRGSTFELKSDFTFKNLKVAITRDGSDVPKIYANGHKLEFDNVNTKLSDGQPNERPELYGGSNSGVSSGSKSTIIIKGDNTESKFTKIYAKGSTDRNDIPVDITVDSSKTNVLQGMDLSSVGAPVNVVTKSNLIYKFKGDENGAISISFEKKDDVDKLDINNVDLTNIQNITLKNSTVRLSGNPRHVTNLNLTDKKSELILNSNIFADEDEYGSSNVFSVSNITGDGTLEIPTDYKLALPNSYDGTANVRINNNSQELDKKEMYITSKNGNINFTYTTEPINKLKKDESGNYVVVDASEVDNSPVTPAPEETPDESTGSDSAGNTGEGGTPGGNDNAENGDGSTEGNGGTPNETGSGTPGSGTNNDSTTPGVEPGEQPGGGSTGTDTDSDNSNDSGTPGEGSTGGSNTGSSNETGSGTPGSGTNTDTPETQPSPGVGNTNDSVTPGAGEQPGGSVTPGAPNGTGTDDDTEKPNTGDSTVTPPAQPGDNDNAGTGEGPNPGEGGDSTGGTEGPKPDGNTVTPPAPGTPEAGEQPGGGSTGTDTDSDNSNDSGTPGNQEGGDGNVSEDNNGESTPGSGTNTDPTTPGVEPGAHPGGTGTGTDDDAEKPNTGDSTVTPPAPGTNTDTPETQPSPGTQPGGTGTGTDADSEKPNTGDSTVTPPAPGTNTDSPKPDGNPSREQPGDTGSSDSTGTDNGSSDNTESGSGGSTPGVGTDTGAGDQPGGNPGTPNENGSGTPGSGTNTDTTTPGVEPGAQPGENTTEPNDSTIPGVTENSNIITPKEIDHKLVENIGDTTVEVLIKDLDSKNYKLKVKDVTKEHEADVLSKISEKVDSIKIFDINLLDVNTETIVKTDKDRTVRVLLTENLEDKTVKVYYVDDITGELTLVPSSVENNTVVFSVNHFSKYAVTISKNNDNQKLPNTGGLSNNNSILGIITMIIALGMSYIRRVFKK